MIYGVIPIGGKGTRLGLPFSKEMLPRKGLDKYSPLVEELVMKMREAGAKTIVFIHGREYKQDVCDYFCQTGEPDSVYIHITQSSPSFAGCLLDFYRQVATKSTDDVLFGLPDSTFVGNPFVEMLKHPGICCGLFTTGEFARVDRFLDEKFHVKTDKAQCNSEWFWGVLKFDVRNISEWMERKAFETHTEIGDILNLAKWKTIICVQEYLDLGTWYNLNLYWNGQAGF